MDDLEKAILAYEPGAADPTFRAQAMAFCDRAKADLSALLRLCLDRLHRSSLVPVHFWCLQALHDAVRLRYSSIPPADLPILRSALLSLASDRPLPAASPPFLRNKLAQTLAALIRLEYPSLWPDPFLRILPCLPSADPSSIDMFARLLVALDDDLLSLDYPRSSAEAADATRVKDAMRQQCIPQIARHWFDVVSLYHSLDTFLAAAALDTMRRYVTWIDIALVANDAFVPLLFELILAPDSIEQLRAAAVGCVLAILQKRMVPRQKVALLRSLPVSRVFADPNLVKSSIFGYWFNAGGTSQEALPSVFYVMQESEEVELGNVVEFLSDYVITMRTPLQKQAVYLGHILEFIRVQICYDPAHRNNLDILDRIGREEEDQMGERRKDLLVLFCSICRLAPDVTQLFIQNLLIRALSSSEASVEEVEATFTLFYRLGETVNEEAMRTGSGLLRELVQMLLSSQFPCLSHRMVALIYLETVMRFMKFVQDNPQYIPYVLAAFLDQRGIHHPNLNVSRRAGYLFMRAVKLMKSKFVPYLDMILRGLQDTITQFTTSDWCSKNLECSVSEDGSQIFEAIGLLIGMEDVSPEKQSDYVAAFLRPLCQKLNEVLLDSKAQGLEESSAKVLTLQQIIMALNALSKGFNARLATSICPAIGIMFKQALSEVLEILIAFPNIKILRNKITSFIHRMVDILGGSIFPCLPVVLKQLLMESEPKDMVDFLVLVNQLISKFSTSVEGILEEIFPAIATRLIVILSKDAFPSGPGCNTEEVRELQELQRILYTFLHLMANHNLSSVFLAPNCRGYLDALMQLLLLAACSHKDVLLRKLCVQIFMKLIKDWCTNCNVDDKVPGFRSFIIEKFATDCCLYSVLDKSFEFHDANTKLCWPKRLCTKLGSDFIIHFVSKGLQAARCPHELTEQYYQKLQQANDIKALKSFYQLLVENLRQQQNGSLESFVDVHYHRDVSKIVKI
ncbi:nucleobase-containing compound transmembrane transporter [Musa troglodytarum]|uniref:Exportin-T n=1 Tax=Musa troglodytarum TaxID=320322 RepID=A0A9E7I5V2_9LILI|nr:nucleobase-containing compound transmembrane transporter [Musa troglodytarum]